MRSFYLGVDLPIEFPTEAYDDAITRIETGRLSRLGREHARVGLFGMAFRYVAMAGADNAFRESLRRQGDVISDTEERVRQETALFLFFAAGCSVIECFSYGAFATGAGIGNSAFKIEKEGQRRQVSPEKTLVALRASDAEPNLIASLDTALSGAEWETMTGTRNVLIHQSSPMRQHFLAKDVRPTRPPSIQQSIHHGEDLEVGTELTAAPRRWLGETVTSLLYGFDLWLAGRD